MATQFSLVNGLTQLVRLRSSDPTARVRYLTSLPSRIDFHYALVNLSLKHDLQN